MTKCTIVATLLLAPTPLRAQELPSALRDTVYVPGAYHVFTGAGRATSISEIVDAMAQHDVVFVGETHDDPTGPELELELLERAYDTYGAERPIQLSLEFFERDTQPIPDEYLAGLIAELSFRRSGQASGRPGAAHGRHVPRRARDRHAGTPCDVLRGYLLHDRPAAGGGTRRDV